jgi:hypothetical protein
MYYSFLSHSSFGTTGALARFRFRYCNIHVSVHSRNPVLYHVLTSVVISQILFNGIDNVNEDARYTWVPQGQMTPVNRISKLDAPTNAMNWPAGLTQPWLLTSQILQKPLHQFRLVKSPNKTHLKSLWVKVILTVTL